MTLVRSSATSDVPVLRLFLSSAFASLLGSQTFGLLWLRLGLLQVTSSPSQAAPCLALVERAFHSEDSAKADGQAAAVPELKGKAACGSRACASKDSSNKGLRLSSKQEAPELSQNHA